MRQQRRSVYIEGTDGLVEAMFLRKGWELVRNPEDADALCLTGGSDISPSIYNQKPIEGVWTNPRRDAIELALVERMENKKPILGICRGAQLLNCLAGGTLWQNVNNHIGEHPAIDLTTGEDLLVSSLHHQLMRPTKDAVILMVAQEATEFQDAFESIRHDADIEESQLPPDIEALWYPDQRWLGIQGHPEYDFDYQNEGSFGPTCEAFFKYIDQFVFQ